jgi:RNA polymerase sigma-70 factor, ECF subfamily
VPANRPRKLAATSGTGKAPKPGATHRRTGAGRLAGPAVRTAGELDYSSPTDQQVVRLALTGRERAFRELIGRYQRPVFSLIYRLVRDRERAEDLAQETFIKVLNALDRYNPEYKFSSWIFKIAHNTALDQLRRKEPETLSLDGSPHARTAAEVEASTITPESTGETPEQYTQNRELGVEIEQALSTLRPEYRTAILLCHVEGRPYEEIAEVMGVPLGTVKTYIHRGRKELMQRLEHLRA